MQGMSSAIGNVFLQLQPGLRKPLSFRFVEIFCETHFYHHNRPDQPFTGGYNSHTDIMA